MRIDECALDELIIESEDLQSDALRDTKATIADDLGEERRGQKVDPGTNLAFRGWPVSDRIFHTSPFDGGGARSRCCVDVRRTPALQPPCAVPAGTTVAARTGIHRPRRPSTRSHP